MNSSDLPTRITKAFGVNGDRNVIPTDSSTVTDNAGVATFNRGFPPITMQPLSAGGIPPSGKDMNGALYAVSLQQQWQNAGMTYPFDADFSTTIGGYPKGALIPNSLYTGQWLNLNEANVNSPESPIGSRTGWVPLGNYGTTSVTGLSNASVTLSSIQAAKDRLILTGTLTANINLVFPAWMKSWTVVNSTTGAFSVVLKTASGSGVVSTSGVTTKIYCDGTIITKEFGTSAYRDVGTGTNQIPDMNSFTSSSNWMKLPSGKIIQMGFFSTTTAGNTIINLPIPFPNAFRSIVATQNDTTFPNVIGCQPIGTTQFRTTTWNYNGGAVSATSVSYIAIGE